ncbi:MAG: hypothetical protein ABL971_00530 [Vicinamibacterales bacterium]
MRDERGTALVVVTVLLGLIAALSAGLGLSATTAMALAGNLASALDARAAADAGVQHGLATALPVFERWKAHGFPSPAEAFTDALSAGLLRRAMDGAGFPAVAMAVPGGVGQSYTVALLDDDAPGRGLARADVPAIGEDGVATSDRNGRVVIRSTGTSLRGASATVEAIVGAAPLPAVLVRGGLTLGAVSVSGTEGHVHVRGEVVVTGDARVTGDLTTTGAPHASSSPAVVGGRFGHARAIPIPDIHPEQFRSLAAFVMAADGAVRTPAGDLLCQPPDVACPPAVAAWRWSSEGWRCPDLPGSATTFYVEGDVVLDPAASLPAGQVALRQVTLSLLATGSITLRGEMHLRPAIPGVLLVAGGDVRIEGALRADAEEGLVAAGEQVAITQASRLAGVILAAGTGARSAVVTRNELGGGLVVVSNGALAAKGVVTVRVLGWRRHQAW